MSHLPVAHQPSFCFLFDVGGAGREAPQKPTVNAAKVQTVLPLKWSGRKRGQGCEILFPVFGGKKAAAKIRTVKGLRVEIFRAVRGKIQLIP